jgi:hypothetical protein
LAAAALAGCYQRVVDAHGPGADRVAIEQGNTPAPDPGTRTLGYPKYELRKLPGSQ